MKKDLKKSLKKKSKKLPVTHIYFKNYNEYEAIINLSSSVISLP